jgi:hypothetical protein
MPKYMPKCFLLLNLLQDMMKYLEGMLDSLDGGVTEKRALQSCKNQLALCFTKSWETILSDSVGKIAVGFPYFFPLFKSHNDPVIASSLLLFTVSLSYQYFRKITALF